MFIAAKKPLLREAQQSHHCFSFISLFILLCLLLFLYITGNHHDNRVFAESTIGTSSVNELDTPPVPRPPEISPKKAGKTPVKESPPPSSSAQAGSSHAGSSQAGASQAGSSRAGSSQAGSSQAGPSGINPSPPILRRQTSPEISIVDDISSYDLLSQQYALDEARRASSKSNPTSHAKCTDPMYGFEAKVGRCERVTSYESFRLTFGDDIFVPLALNALGKCDARVCQIRDLYNCCETRRKCNPNYMNEVEEGCPANEIVNPYAGAFCRTVPCTIGDIDTCCINPGSLFQRAELLRSNYARVQPDDSSAPVIPRISFGYRDVVWFDISRMKVIREDDWAPLVNFMKTWGDDKGWKTEAWLRISRKGKMKYRALPQEKLFPNQRPRASVQHVADDRPEANELDEAQVPVQSVTNALMKTHFHTI